MKISKTVHEIVRDWPLLSNGEEDISAKTKFVRDTVRQTTKSMTPLAKMLIDRQGELHLLRKQIISEGLPSFSKEENALVVAAIDTQITSVQMTKERSDEMLERLGWILQQNDFYDLESMIPKVTGSELLQAVLQVSFNSEKYQEPLWWLKTWDDGVNEELTAYFKSVGVEP